MISFLPAFLRPWVAKDNHSSTYERKKKWISNQKKKTRFEKHTWACSTALFPRSSGLLAWDTRYLTIALGVSIFSPETCLLHKIKLFWNHRSYFQRKLFASSKLDIGLEELVDKTNFVAWFFGNSKCGSHLGQEKKRGKGKKLNFEKKKCVKMLSGLCL